MQPGRPPERAVDVWTASPWSVDPDAFHGWLDSTERERAAGLPAGQRSGFVVARALLRAVVAERLGCRPASVALRVVCPACGGPHGAVRVVDTRSPATLETLRVSLTRSGPLLAVAVSTAGDVGIDVESWAAVGASPLADVALSPAEAGELAIVGPQDRAETLARAWVRKEAALKALGTGLRTDPRTLDVRHDVVTSDGGAIPVGLRVVVADLDLGAEPGLGGAVALAEVAAPGAPRPLTVRRHEGAPLLAAG